MIAREQPAGVKFIRWIPERMLVKEVLDTFGGLSGMNSNGIRRHRDVLTIRTPKSDVIVNPGDLIVQWPDGDIRVIPAESLEQVDE